MRFEVARHTPPLSISRESRVAVNTADKHAECWQTRGLKIMQSAS